MKNKFKIRWQFIVIIILILALVFLIYAYIKKINGESIFKTSNNSSVTSQDSSTSTDTESSSSTTTEEVSASIQTITNTLSSSGEVSSNLSEKLQLHSTYYFEEVYYSEGDYVSEGENIVKYSNGTYLTAPYNLVIKSLSVPSQGEECTSKNYVEAESTDTLTISASVDEDDLSTVSIGQQAKITISALDNKEYTGYVTKISQTGKYSSNGSTYSVTITFSNDGDIKIGMSASCEIILEEAQDVVTVPVEAVQTSSSDSTKYVVVVKDDGTTENVTVSTGISNNAYIEIKSGLTGTETVQITETTKSTRGNGSMGSGNMPGGSQQSSSSGGPGGSSSTQGGTPPSN